MALPDFFSGKSVKRIIKNNKIDDLAFNFRRRCGLRTVLGIVKEGTYLSAGCFGRSTDDNCVDFDLVCVDAVLAIQFDGCRQYSQF